MLKIKTLGTIGLFAAVVIQLISPADATNNKFTNDFKRCANPVGNFTMAATNYGEGGYSILQQVPDSCEFALPENAEGWQWVPSFSPSSGRDEKAYVAYDASWWNTLEIIWTAPSAATVSITSAFVDTGNDDHVYFFQNGTYLGGGGTFGSTLQDPTVYDFNSITVAKGDTLTLQFDPEGCCTGTGLASLEISFTRL
jgi:hypothetical protein